MAITPEEHIDALVCALERAIHGGCTWHEGSSLVEAEAVVERAKESRKDWRIGLRCKPKMRSHPLYHETCEIVDVIAPGCYGIYDPDGVLRIRTSRSGVIIAAAHEWITG